MSENEDSKPEVKRKKSEDTPILLSRYFELFASSVHPYTQAFVSDSYRGILKTKEEWDQELTGKI